MKPNCQNAFSINFDVELLKIICLITGCSVLKYSSLVQCRVFHIEQEKSRSYNLVTPKVILRALVYDGARKQCPSPSTNYVLV